MLNQKINNLLKDPRTNWKYICIVVILGFLAAGGTLGYYYLWLTELETKLAEIEVRLPEKAAKDEAADWKTYEAPQIGFVIKYPPDWRIIMFKEAPLPPDVADLLNVKLRLYAPNDEASMLFWSGIPYESGPIPQQISIEKAISKHRELLSGPFYYFFSEENIIIGDKSAVKFTSIVNIGEHVVIDEFLQETFVPPNENKLLLIQGSTLASNREVYEPIFNQILSTIRF